MRNDEIKAVKEKKEQAEELSQEDESIDLGVWQPVIMQMLAMINLKTATFQSKVNQFMEEGPTQDNGGKGLLVQAYKALARHEIKSMGQETLESAGLLQLNKLVQYLTRPGIVEAMSGVVKQILNPVEQEIEDESLYNLIEQARKSNSLDKTYFKLNNFEIINKIRDGELTLIQAYKPSETGVNASNFIIELVPNQKAKEVIAFLKQKAGFIKVFADNKVTHEFRPNDNELVECLALAIENNDQEFIKLCNDNNLLREGMLNDQIDLFYQAYSRGRLDSIAIMLENKLFDFKEKEALERLAICLAYSFKNDDSEFIKLCIDNKVLSKGLLKEHMDVFFQVYDDGKDELFRIMIEYELYDFNGKSHPKKLAACLESAFKNNDSEFIKLCIDHRVLTKGLLKGHMDLFYQTYARGRDDLLDIMVEHELFGFKAEEVPAKIAGYLTKAFIDEDLDFIKLCIDNNMLKGGMLNDQIGLFLDMHIREKVDLLKIMLEHKLFDFKEKEASERLAICLAYSFKKNDTEFIKLCIDNGVLRKGLLKEYTDLFDESYMSGRFDLLDIMLEHKLFDSEEEETLKKFAGCLVKAFENNDDAFIKRYIDKGKLSKGLLKDPIHIDLFYRTYARGRFDLLDIMIEHQLFGFGEEEIATVNELLSSGTTRLIEACKKGDAELARTLLAMGADPTMAGKDGYNALMYAVRYSEEEIKEINKPGEEQSVAIEELKQGKNEIVEAILKDKRIDINAKSKSDNKSAMQILIEQGLTMGENGITELRGDHGSMEKLIAAGANPVFGKFELSFKAKFLMTIGLSIVLTGIKNQVFNYIGLSFVGRILLHPVYRAVDWVLNGVIAYKAYLDAKSPLYQATRTFLDSKYADDTLINLEEKAMIGAYHINWYGKVIAGDNLKDYLSTHVGYTGTTKAYYKAGDLPTKESKDLDMPIKSQLEMAEALFNRYYRLKEDLKNHWMAPWTREALGDLKNEIKEAYASLSFQYKIGKGFEEQLRLTFALHNHERLVEEIFNSPEQRALFYKINSAVKQGALACDIKTRYNLEKFEQRLHNPNLLKEVKAKRAHDALEIKIFKKFAEFCHSLEEQGVDFNTTLKIIEHDFKERLENNHEDKTLFEIVKEKSGNFMRATLDTAVTGVAYVTGSSRGRVYHYLAEGISSTGAAANAAVHVGIREFYDSSYFLPTVTAVVGACAIYKWPDKAWAVCKFAFYATTFIAGVVYQAAAYMVTSVINTVKYIMELTQSIGEEKPITQDTPQPSRSHTEKLEEQVKLLPVAAPAV